jgi:hypothetical protein
MELSSPVHPYGICVWAHEGACLTDDERREYPVTRWGRRSKITFDVDELDDAADQHKRKKRKKRYIIVKWPGNDGSGG